jgi:hypothetical protein
VNAQEPLMLYIAAGVTFLAAAGLAIRGDLPQAAILAAGAAFLIYWARRSDRQQGER